MVEQAERREGRRETGERELREAVETRGGREKGEREERQRSKSKREGNRAVCVVGQTCGRAG